MKHTPLNTDIKKYIIDVKSYLICDWKTRNRFIRDLKNDIFDFVDENENVSMDDIRQRFGEPQDIAKGFFENADIKKIKRRMNIGRTVIIGVIAALLIWLGVLLFAVLHPYVDEPTSYVVEYMQDGIVQGEVVHETV